MRRALSAPALVLALICAKTAYADGAPIPRLVPPLESPFKDGDRAQEAPSVSSSWAARPRAVNVNGGSGGGPLGYGGFSFEYAPVPWFVAGAGAGYAPSGPTGAIMPRLRLPLTRTFAVGLGFPLSLGPYEYVFQQPEQCGLAGCSTGWKTTRTWSMAFWGYLEPNVEVRIAGGTALRFYGGYAKVLNPHDDRCTSTERTGCPSALGEQRWYGGMALGYAW